MVNAKHFSGNETVREDGARDGETLDLTTEWKEQSRLACAIEMLAH